MRKNRSLKEILIENSNGKSSVNDFASCLLENESSVLESFDYSELNGSIDIAMWENLNKVIKLGTLKKFAMRGMYNSSAKALMDSTNAELTW